MVGPVPIVFTILTTGLTVASIFDTQGASDQYFSAVNFSSHSVIANLQVRLQNDAGFRRSLEHAINASKDHGPNSEAPWTVVDVVRGFERELTYQPLSPLPYSEFSYFLVQFGDLLLSSIWEGPEWLQWLQNFVTVRGQFFYSPETLPAVTKWLTSPWINTSDFIVPPGGFRSFGDFFSRLLRPGVRPIDNATDPLVVVSPVDGVWGAYTPGLSLSRSRLKVKGPTPVNLTQLLANDTLARRFEGGFGMQLYLQSYSYHRFHSPVDGIVRSVVMSGAQHYFGGAFPDWGYRYHRAVITIETEQLGLVAFVPVGIWAVSSVIPFVSVGTVLRKGDQIGRFDLGGSAVFMAFEPSLNATKTLNCGGGKYKNNDPIVLGRALCYAA